MKIGINLFQLSGSNFDFDMRKIGRKLVSIFLTEYIYLYTISALPEYILKK
jgi:hypothetical protein